MEPFALELSLQVIEGATHGLGEVTLWTCLLANTHNPSQPSPRMVGLVRTTSHWSPPLVFERSPSRESVASLVDRLRALCWPGRALAVMAVETAMAGYQELRLRVSLDGREEEMRLTLQYGGMSGPDAATLREILRAVLTLGEMSISEAERWITGTAPRPPQG
jgi:hypothetical protein